MARFDVDASGVTYVPSSIEWIPPQRLRRGDAGSTRPIYWQCRLSFEADGGLVPAAAYEEWRAFDDYATHSIVLPPDDDVLGGDATYTGIYIEIERQPPYRSVQVGPFTVLVSGADITT